MNIHVGDEIELTEEVVPENTAEKWGSGSLPVYATPAMISLIEQSAVNLLAGKLDEGQTTVGTNLNIAHVSATPVGGTIKCVSSDTGDEYTAEVKEISDFPTGDSSNDGGSSNPNSSYYPVIGFIKDADGLSPGGSVEVSYSSKSMGTANDNAIYIQKAYIRTEDKKNYVYIRDKKTKRLKKQYVKVGKTMNGQYMEIISGLTDEDNIAFPYGKNLREGVKTKISEDDSEMIY